MLTILVALNDAIAQQELVEMLRTIYHQKVSILQPQYEGHLEILITEHYTDIIFISLDQILLRRIRHETSEPVIIALGPSGNDEYEQELIAEGVQDILHATDLNHKRLLRTIEYARRRHQNLLEATSFMRLERDIAQRVTMVSLLELVTDIILRRTGAKGCLIGWITPHSDILTVLTKVGRVGFIPPDTPVHEVIQHPSLLGELFRKEGMNVSVVFDGATNHLLLALQDNKERKGFISLEGMPYLPPSADQLRFLRYLSGRLVMALERVQAHERMQYHIRQMTNLYKVSVSITSVIGKEDALELGAWGLAGLLEVGGAFACDYDPERHVLTVQGRHATFQLDPYLPAHGAVIDLNRMRSLSAALHTGVIQRYRLPLESDLLFELNSLSSTAMLIVPLLQDDQLVGAVVACHDDHTRHFLPDDLAVAQSFAIYLMTVLNQAELYAYVHQLQEAKSEMIQRVSHDLKNPINLLTGYVSLLQESIDWPSDEQVMYFGAIDRSITTMKDLVSDILVLEKVETFMEAPMQPINIVGVVREILQIAQQEAQLKRQTVTLQMPIDECWVLGDHMQLFQAAQNLVGNALKYTPDEGTVTIRANAIDGEFWFEVEDDGYGIPQEKRERLFERFYRAQSPGTEHIKGTGLGLYLVKTVAERHRGHVWYQNAPERGSIFGFRVPMQPT